MNYTKGKRYVKQLNGHVNICIDGVVIAESFGDIANAHLITAAPKMYELLKILAYEIRQSDNPQALWEGLLHTVAAKIDPILAKAEG